jgi:hypothetical protein
VKILERVIASLSLSLSLSVSQCLTVLPNDNETLTTIDRSTQEEVDILVPIPTGTRKQHIDYTLRNHCLRVELLPFGETEGGGGVSVWVGGWMRCSSMG